jgi:two-component system cell cycle sensor histidine kinase/response regulator CckA
MVSARYLDRSVPAWVRALLAALALCAALYAVLLVGGGEAVGLPLDPDSWGPIGVLALASAFACGVRAATRRCERLVWSLLAAGMLCSGAGFIAWAALFENDAAPPYPSLADACWIPYFVLLLAALAALVRAERPHIPPTAWLDALIPACAVSAVATQLLLPHVSTGGKPLAEQVTLLAYPALDVLLVVATVLVLALRRWEPDARWGLLALAVLGSALGDVLWSYLVASGKHEVGAAADLPYLLTPVAIAWAAWAPRGKAITRHDDRLTLLLPAMAAACALGLLLYGALTADLILPSLALAVAAVGAGVFRWWLALRREAQAMVLREVASELSRKADQQAAVADLGRRAIATADVDRLMSLATAVVSTILDAERVVVLELGPGGSQLVPRTDSGSDDDDVPDLQALGVAALAAGTPTVLMPNAVCARIERKDGSWGVLAVLHRRARDFGDDDVSFVQAVANVLGAVVARAREEQLEAQLQQSRRLESVGKLAGGVAHDFNNLLAIILNYADFALEAATDDEQRRDLEELSKAAARGAELVRQLLAFSRRRPVDAVALDLTEVVRDMEPMLRRTIGEHIELRCWLASELPPTVIDPGQLTQVLVNLAVNARDAMPDGGSLTIKATQVDCGVRLVVEDTGHGMSEETLAKAFDPFFTTKPPGSGTGLGLATVYGIVAQADGTIALDSAAGRGTRVVIELPCRDSALAPERAAESPAPSGGRGETILVVEDDQQVRGIAGRILREHGYHVVEASGGEEALHAAASEPRGIDLLLSDVVMPGMSGPELADHLRRAQPGVRVLHMSGYTSGIGGPDPRTALPELIEKPFTSVELLARVRTLLGEPELSASAG